MYDDDIVMHWRHWRHTVLIVVYYYTVIQYRTWSKPSCIPTKSISVVLTCSRELCSWTCFSRAGILVLAGTAGAGRMTPPTSIRISARLKCVHGPHVLPVNVLRAAQARAQPVGAAAVPDHAIDIAIVNMKCLSM